MVKTRVLRMKSLKSVSRQWMHWKISIKKMKAIYHTMNLFNVDVTKKCLLGRCWVPTSDLARVRDIFENCDVSIHYCFVYNIDSKAKYYLPRLYQSTALPA